MKHRTAQKRFLALADGSLARPEATALEQHLEKCESCRRAWTDFLAVRELAGKVAMESHIVPDSISDGTMAQLRMERHFVQPKVRPIVFYPAAASAAVALLVLVFAFLSPEGPRPAPPDSLAFYVGSFAGLLVFAGLILALFSGLRAVTAKWLTSSTLVIVVAVFVLLAGALQALVSFFFGGGP